MSWTARSLACLALLPSLALAGGSCERLVATASPDAPPFAWRDPAEPGRLIGASIDILSQVSGELGVKIDVLYTGRRSQALEEARSGRVDLLADAVLNEQDLTRLDYVYPPLAYNEYVPWVRQGANPAYGSLADLAGAQGIVSGKARLTPAFQAFAATHLKLTVAESLSQALRRLAQGEAQYAIAPRYAGAAAVEALGLTGQLVPTEVSVDRPGIYLAIAQDSACNDGWLRGQLAKKMTELAASGGIQAILQRNAERWKLQQQAAGATAKP
ncbi:substrate-binding periplasmic protein [Pseudomonas massiliensis]|uniref:substrate-binding periplasmic protein n=1 Tax=Pseudomonas massiliensis TaxID=522492 RepID=UPI00058D4646|nr:transporter substrate-binding domain-containing protein [Pseudomonas massiliensis]